MAKGVKSKVKGLRNLYTKKEVDDIKEQLNKGVKVPKSMQHQASYTYSVKRATKA